MIIAYHKFSPIIPQQVNWLIIIKPIRKHCICLPSIQNVYQWFHKSEFHKLIASNCWIVEYQLKNFAEMWWILNEFLELQFPISVVILITLPILERLVFLH